MFSFLLLVWIRRLTFFPFLVLTCFYLELIAVPLLIGSSFLIYFLWTQKLFPKWIGQLLQIYINKCIYFLLALWCKTVILFLQLFGIKFRIFIEKKEEKKILLNPVQNLVLYFPIILQMQTGCSYGIL